MLKSITYCYFSYPHEPSTYNADFDGDEINVHFPQDEISRAEAYNIVNANNQYVKPTSGDPIRALIQVLACIIKKGLLSASGSHHCEVQWELDVKNLTP